MIVLLTLLLAAQYTQAGRISDWWRGFCERNLVADDPYQFENLSVPELVYIFDTGSAREVVVREMTKRLEWDAKGIILLPKRDRVVIELLLKKEE